MSIISIEQMLAIFLSKLTSVCLAVKSSGKSVRLTGWCTRRPASPRPDGDFYWWEAGVMWITSIHPRPPRPTAHIRRRLSDLISDLVQDNEMSCMGRGGNVRLIPTRIPRYKAATVGACDTC
jgi:hypothetical protein